MAAGLPACARSDQTIYNNLSASSVGADQILNVGPLFDSFTATAGETLTGLQLALGNYGPAGTGNLSVGLYTLSTLDSTAIPTLIANLGTISNSAITVGSLRNYSVSLVVNPGLTAGTRYWIGLTDYADGAITWSWSPDTSGFGVASEYSAYGGGVVRTNAAGGAYQMTVSVSLNKTGLIYNNLGATSSGTDQILYEGPLFDSFTATTNETIASLQLALGNYGPATGSGILNVGLYTLSTLDDYAVPTLITPLGTISNSSIATGSSNYSVTLQNHPSLTAGRRYWIGLDDYADGSITWSWSADVSGIGVGGEYLAYGGGVVETNSLNGPYQMALSAFPIPKGVIYNNLGATSSGADQILVNGPQFVSFTPAVNETITSLQLALENYSTGGSSGNLDVGLYTLSTLDDDAVPTLVAALGSISNSAILATGINDYSVPLQTHPTLIAGTRYWIGLCDPDINVAWSWSSEISGGGVNGEYWANDGGVVHSNSMQGPYQMLLAATPLPPSLTIAQSGTNVIISWPNAGNCTLQQKSDLSGWVTSVYPVNTNNFTGINSVTVSAATGSLFFRLAAPFGM